jgi:hypothetical protein
MAAFSGGPRNAGEAERRQREGDAVGDREGGDGLNELPGAADDHQKPEHEQDVVDPEQDVMEAEHQVLAGGGGPGTHPAQLGVGLGRAQHLGRLAAIETGDADEDVGDGRLKSGQADQAAVECRPVQRNDLPVQRGVGELAHGRLGHRAPIARQLQPGRVRLAVVDRRPPGDLPAILGQLAQLEQARLRFVCRRDRGQQQGRDPGGVPEHQPDERTGHASRLGAHPPVPPVADAAGSGISKGSMITS